MQTRANIYRMEEQGLLTGRWELIGGELIPKTGTNALHEYVLHLILPWLSRVCGVLLRCRSAMEVYEADRALNAPLPDFAVVREMKEEYARRVPRGDELTLVIEVSDTSIRTDLSMKVRLYARSGVPEYWVVDIARRRVVIHRHVEQGIYQDAEKVTKTIQPPMNAD